MSKSKHTLWEVKYPETYGYRSYITCEVDDLVNRGTRTEYVTGWLDLDTAKQIVEEHNAAPTLTADLATAKVENTELRKALWAYEGKPCDCSQGEVWSGGDMRTCPKCDGASFVEADERPYAALTAELGKAESKLSRLREAAEELQDLMQGVIDGEYKPDTLTLQPIRTALAEIEVDND